MTLNLASDTVFTDSEATRPFLCDQTDAHIKMTFTGVDGLTFGGKQVFAGPSVRVYEKNGTWERVFLLPVSDKAAAVVTPESDGYACRYDKKYTRYFTSSINLLNTVGLERAAYDCGMYYLHCSFVEMRGRAVLFAGSSGVGKSTRAGLFERYADASIVNHDKALLYFENGKLMACGSPISGSSPIIQNESHPVAAIVFLEQAETNRIRRLPYAEAVAKLVKNTVVNTWDSQFYQDALQFACDCVNAVGFYESVCDVSPESVQIQRKELGL